MTLFSKFFGKKTAADSLGNMSPEVRADFDAQTAKKKFVTRAPRIRLQQLHNVGCRLGTGAQRPRIANISTTGVGFLRDSLATWPEEQSSLEAEFSFEGSVHVLEVQFVHSNAEIVGCQFVNPSRELVLQISKYFSFEVAALNLVKIDSSVMRPVPDGTATWIEGENNCGLYYVINDEKIVRFTLNFFGNRVEGGAGAPLRFGQQVRNDASNSMYGENSIMKWAKTWPEEMVRSAQRFLSAIHFLDEATAEKLRVLIEKIPRE